MVGWFSSFCGRGYIRETTAAVYAYGNCTAMGPAGCLWEAAVLHYSPWETITTDPTYQTKINLDQKSLFPLPFTLKPLRPPPPCWRGLALASWTGGYRCSKECISQNCSLHMKKYFSPYLLDANIVSQCFQAWSHLTVDCLSLRPLPYLWQVLHSSKSYLLSCHITLEPSQEFL